TSSTPSYSSPSRARTISASLRPARREKYVAGERARPRSAKSSTKISQISGSSSDSVPLKSKTTALGVGMGNPYHRRRRASVSAGRRSRAARCRHEHRRREAREADGERIGLALLVLEPFLAHDRGADDPAADVPDGLRREPGVGAA